LPFSGLLALACCVQDAGKIGMVVLAEFDGSEYETYTRSSRHASRFKLTRSLVGCGIQIRSSRCSRSCWCSESEQILTSNCLTISLRAPEDCYRCGSLQLALTAYFRNMEVPSLTDHIKYWIETIKSLGYRNGMLTRFEILACPPHFACRRPALGSASVFVALSSDRNRHQFCMSVFVP
jgi:hypothetical protein